MIYSIAISETINPTAPVPLTGNLYDQMRIASSLGYHGVEIHTPSVDILDIDRICSLAKELGLQITTLGTGTIYGKFGLSLTDPDFLKRQLLITMVKEYIDVAALFKSCVTIGSIKGNIDMSIVDISMNRVLECLKDISNYAVLKGVDILLEATNRYESNYFNTGNAVASFIRDNHLKNMYLLLDAFHVNIEEDNLKDCFSSIKDELGYVHFSDNNRFYPSGGCFNFDTFIGDLKEIGYNGVVSIECLPIPDGYSAAEHSISFFHSYFG